MRKNHVLLGVLMATLTVGAVSASTVIGLSVEDQTRLSKLVVVGEVVSQNGVEHPENGIETAVSLRVTDVLKGDASPGDVVVFHTRGGEVGGVISEGVGEARFNVGQKALVFIEEVDGRRYNLGLSLGVWNVHERDGAAVSFTRAVRDGLEIVGEDAVELGPISYRDMASRVAWAGRHRQFDSLMLREQLGQGR